jgi:hypothetical protein
MLGTFRRGEPKAAATTNRAKGSDVRRSMSWAERPHCPLHPHLT